VGHRGGRGHVAAVGDREGREREPGGGGGGDVRGGTRERDDHGRQSDDQREWRGDGGELDPERHGGLEHVDGQFRDLVRQPGYVHGDGHSRSGGADPARRSSDLVGHRGGGGQVAAVGDREGRERESGGGSGGDVHAGGGEWRRD